jgi:hypothetical protein
VPADDLPPQDEDDELDGEFDDEFTDEFDDELYGEDAYDGDEFAEHADPSPIRRFADRSAIGMVAAASLRGLRDVLQGPPKEEVQVVADWNGDKPFTDPYVLRLDPDHPEDSIVMVRPWLVKGEADEPADQENNSDTSTRRPSSADT